MADAGKAVERRRLAEALRANLKRRKMVARPVQDAPQDTPAAASAEPRPSGDRG